MKIVISDTSPIINLAIDPLAQIPSIPIFVKKYAMKVIKIVEEDIADKIDTAYISDQFRHIEKVGITFICTIRRRNRFCTN